MRAVSKDHVNAARSRGASKRQVLVEVVLPSSVPSILTGIHLALSAGWTTLVAATRGIGFIVLSAAQFLVTDIVIAGIIVIALIAVLLEYIARLIERRLVPWASHRSDHAGAQLSASPRFATVAVNRRPSCLAGRIGRSPLAFRRSRKS